MPVAEQAPQSNFQENVGLDIAADLYRLQHEAPPAELYNAELSLSGLEPYGAGGGEGELSIATRWEQLERYQGRWQRFEFAGIGYLPFDHEGPYDIVGGVFASSGPEIYGGGLPVYFWQIASSARGIPPAHWKILCPENFLWFKMYPASNVFVTLTPQDDWGTAMVTIRTMKDGLPHPKAQRQVITSRTVFASDEWCAQLYLNGSRLGVVFKPSDPADSRFSVVVWDWTTGELVLRLENARRKAIQFLDEQRIIVWEDYDDFLDIYDTSHAAEVGCASGNRVLRLGLPEATYYDVKMHSGSHHGSKPAHMEGVVPFFPADSAKIMVIDTITDNEPTSESAGSSIVVSIEDILRASRTRPFGSVVRWEEWCWMAANIDFLCFPGQLDIEREFFVAGSRFISLPIEFGSTGFRRLEIYDFNPRYIKLVQATGRKNVTIMGKGGLEFTRAQVIIPWSKDETSATRSLVHLTEDHVILEDTKYQSESGTRLMVLSV